MKKELCANATLVPPGDSQNVICVMLSAVYFRIRDIYRFDS